MITAHLAVGMETWFVVMVVLVRSILNASIRRSMRANSPMNGSAIFASTLVYRHQNQQEALVLSL